MSTLGDRSSVVARVDPGREVRHVEDEAGEVDRELFDHRSDNATLDLAEVLFGDRVHCLPKAPVVECSMAEMEPPVTCGRSPPLGKGELRARVDYPVQGRKRDVAPDRRTCIGTTRA